MIGEKSSGSAPVGGPAGPTAPAHDSLTGLALRFLEDTAPRLAGGEAYQAVLEAIVRYGLVRPLLRGLLVRAPLQ